MQLIKHTLITFILILSYSTSYALTTWNSVYPAPTPNSIQGVIWDGAQYVGVTKGGTAFTSSDLNTYSFKTISQRNLTQIAHNGSQYVAVGEFGTVLISSDGNNWSSVSSLTTKNLNAIVWTGSLWVAAGATGTIITSSDGTNWATRTSGTNSELITIASSGSLILASVKSTSQAGTLLSSTDGITWTTASTLNIKSIIWDGTRFVGLSSPFNNSFKTTVSTDGINWTDQPSFPTLGSSGIANSIYWNGTEYLAIGTVAFNQQSVYVGTDLQTWTTSPTLEKINDIASKGGAQWLTSHALGKFSETLDNVTWNAKGTDPTILQHLNDVIYANNQFVAVGESGSVLTSSNGTSWVRQTSGTTEDLRAITWSGSQYITVARGTGFGAAADAVVLTSPDGVTWTNLNVGFVATLQSVAANGNTIVVGSENSLKTSTDNGATWPNTFSKRASDIVWNGTIFATTGSAGFATSADGITWTTSTATYEPIRMIWDGSQFVGVGTNKGRVHTSTDGNAWANISKTQLAFEWQDIVKVNNVYFAVGSGAGTINGTSIQSSMIGNLGSAPSPANITEEISGQGDSGREWTSNTKPSFGTNWGLSSLATDGTTIVAVGSDSTILTRAVPPTSVFTPCSAGTGFGAANVTGSAVSRVRNCFIATAGTSNSNENSFIWKAPNVAPVGVVTPEWEIQLTSSVITMTAGLDRWLSNASLTGFAGLGVSIDSLNKTVTFNQSTLNGSGGAIILEGTLSYSVVVADVQAPVITLTGFSSVTITQGSTYNDQGATASDNIDGDISAQITTTNPVNTAVLGTYTVRYNVTDAASNAATEVTRTVTVQSAGSGGDTVKPVISLNGASSITIDIGNSYSDLGATANDNVDGDISAQITTTNPVNTAVLGTYTVRYNVTDAAGNTAVEATRTVIVQTASSSGSGSSSSSSGGGGSLNIWMLMSLIIMRVFASKARRTD